MEQWYIFQHDMSNIKSILYEKIETVMNNDVPIFDANFGKIFYFSTTVQQCFFL